MRYPMGISGLVSRIDDAVKARAVKHAKGFKEKGVDRHKEKLAYEFARDEAQRAAGTINPMGVDDYLRNNAPDDKYAEFARMAKEGGAQHTDYIAGRLNRGPGSNAQMGPLETVARRTATNSNLRHGGLAALGAGTAVASTAALTEGAQQLLALMSYMQGQKQTEERAATSELNQAGQPVVMV